jgi:TonB-linked SusC/RagA family outer membrane protein
MKKFLLTCFTLAIALYSMAQQRTISGTVTSSEDGSSLPGVNVLLKGTTTGTATDADGKFSLAIPSSDGTLVFSFIGLEAKEVPIGSQTVINVSLASDITQLSEVVVVGYGTQTKRDLNGSIASISGKDIATMPIQSFDQQLQGRAAGVNVVTPNGVLNNPPVIRIRGISSISLSSFPLVVIDGIPTFTGDNSGSNAANNPLSNINPADIESIEVLKDASASAIYGSRAAAGVILVTTKRGAKGKSKVSLESWVGITNPVRLLNVLNAEEYTMIKNEGRVNAGLLPGYATSTDANGNVIDTDWYKVAYRTGVSSSNTINFSGASDLTSYYVSVGHTDQKGMITNNDFKRTSARISLDHKVFDKFKVGTTFAYSNNFNSAPSTGSLAGSAFSTAGLARLAFLTSPNVGPYLPDGSYNNNGANIGSMNNIDPVSGTPLQVGFANPKAILDLNTFTSSANQIQGSVYASWEIAKGLTIKTTYGIDRLLIEDKSFLTGLTGDGQSSNGSATNLYRTRNRWNWQNTAQYDVKFAEKHSLSALVGGEQQYSTDERWGANRTTLADPFFTTFQGNYTNIAVTGNIQTENFLLSYFGRVNYDFNKKYFASINVRRDGYSAWANKYGNFYGASVGYSISEEEFWKSSALSNTINFLKLKASYGEVGNSQGIADFASLQTYASGLYGSNPTLFYNQAGNPALTWETSKKTDIGVTFGLLQDRLQGEIAYYNNQVDGLILNVNQSPSKGIPNPVAANVNTIPANVGSMENKGIELSLKFSAITKTDFKWTINANVTTLKNKVLALVTDADRLFTATSGLESPSVTVVGKSVGSFLAAPTLGVNPENGRRLFQKADGTVVQYDHSAPAVSRWTTLDGTPTTAVTQLADGVIMGPSLPKWYGGLDNTFNYKNFDLGVFVQFSGGNYIYNGTKAGMRDQRFWNSSTDVLDRWTPEHTNGTIPRIVAGDNVSNGSTIVSSQNIEKGDFLRFRNISLGYAIPRTILDKLKISNARIYSSVQNAFLITKYSGFDPEIESNGNTTTAAGVDRNSVGQARTITFGLNIGL